MLTLIPILSPIIIGATPTRMVMFRLIIMLLDSEQSQSLRSSRVPSGNIRSILYLFAVIA